MAQPLTVFPGAEVFAKLNLVAHTRQSYDIFASLGVKSINPHVADQQVSLASASLRYVICSKLAEGDRVT